MIRVYFDGTFDTAGHVLAACHAGQQRVWIVTHRNMNRREQAFLDKLRDVKGSLGHFENGRFRRHQSTGSERFCQPVVKDGVEGFFSYLADRDAVPDERKYEIIAMLRPCHGSNCNGCSRCVYANSVAEAYGFYDILVDDC